VKRITIIGHDGAAKLGDECTVKWNDKVAYDATIEALGMHVYFKPSVYVMS